MKVREILEKMWWSCMVSIFRHEQSDNTMGQGKPEGDR